jgi:hypothetical protein
VSDKKDKGSRCRPSATDNPDYYANYYAAFALFTALLGWSFARNHEQTLTMENCIVIEGGSRGVASNRKGCDIGYGLAANSCEGVNSVDACTVTALDAITAFAVPNPGGILAEQSVFSGLVVRRVAPVNGSLSLLQTGYD